MSARKKILLCWPIFQALYPKPFETFAQICIGAGRYNADYLFGVKVLERMSLVTGMNLVARLVVEQDWDALIVFDDDCFPPVDVIPRLLTRCFDEGHPIVAAAGVMRGYPFTTTAAQYYPEGQTLLPDGTMAGHRWLDDLPSDLVDVDFCGVPAAIIHRRVFDAVETPWFGDMDHDGTRMTHDVYFCRKAKAAGFPVKVDGSIRCGHLLDAPIVTFENREHARGIAAGAA